MKNSLEISLLFGCFFIFASFFCANAFAQDAKNAGRASSNFGRDDVADAAQEAADEAAKYADAAPSQHSWSDFRRANSLSESERLWRANGSPVAARWVAFSENSAGPVWVDLKTVGRRPEYVSVWIKRDVSTKNLPRAAAFRGRYSLLCGSRALITGPFTYLDVDGSSIFSSSDSDIGDRQIIQPDTLGEDLYEFVCESD